MYPRTRRAVPNRRAFNGPHWLKLMDEAMCAIFRRNVAFASSLGAARSLNSYCASVYPSTNFLTLSRMGVKPQDGVGDRRHHQKRCKLPFPRLEARNLPTNDRTGSAAHRV